VNQKICWWKLTTYIRWVVATGGLIYAVGARAQTSDPWDLETYLRQVGENNALVKAARLQKESATLKKRQGDFQELSPFLQAEAGYSNDGQETAFPTQQGTRTKAKYYSLGVSQKLASGTALSIQWGQTHADIEGLAFPYQPVWDSKYTLGISQSLLKDGFGRATRLRHEREDAGERVSVLTAELQQRQALIDAESAYWDFAVQVLDRQEKADAMKRAEKIRDWTARRLANGIADRADRLQVESLIASRSLAQIGSADAYVAARKRFADAIGVSESEVAELKAVSLQQERPLRAEGPEPRRLDIWIQSYASKISEAAALETGEMLRPDLALQGAFGANARDSGLSDSAGDAVASDASFYRVGLKLSMSLDFGMKHRLREAANAEAKASRLKSDKLVSDSASSWSELLRRHREVSASIAAMELLVKAQEAQLAREQERLEVGRTTTFQVVSFEQSVADTRFGLLQLRAQQRKLEAASNLYLSQNAVEAL